MLGVAGVIGGVVLGLKGAAEAAMAEERNIAKLDAALAANIKGWDGNRDAIEQRILAGERLAFNDDAQRASLALLVGATHDVTKAQTIQATAMDLARLKGIGLEEASAALVKVEGGQFRALKALGIILPKNATATQALAAVQAVAAGQAQKYADTTGGAFESLGIVFGDIVEDVGSMLLPVLKDLALFARDTLIPAIRDIGETIGGVIEFFGPVIDAITGFADLIGDTFGAVADRFNELTGNVQAEAKKISDEMIALGKTPEAIAADLRESNVIGAAARMGITDPLILATQDAKDDSVEIAKTVPAALANALRDRRTEWQKAVDQLKTDAENSMTTTVEIAKIKGELAAIALSKGWKSGDPVWAQSLLGTQITLNNRLAELQGSAATYGTNTGKTYVGHVASGIRHDMYMVKASLAGMAKLLYAASPPGPESPLHDIGKWAMRTGQTYIANLARGLGAEGIRDALGSVAGAFGTEPMRGAAFGAAVSGAAQQGGFGAGGVPVSIPIFLDGRQIAEVVDENLYYARAAAAR